MARGPTARGHRPGGHRHQGPDPDRRRPQRRRDVPAAPGPGAGHDAAPARHRHHRPVPAPRMGPADPDRGVAVVPRLRRPDGEDPLRRPVELHRMAAPARGLQYTSSNYETSSRTWDAVDAVRQVAKEAGVSPAQVALSWVTSRPGVTSAIVGARNAQQLTSSLAAASLHLDPDALAVLDAASDPDRRPIPTARSAQPSATGWRTAPRPSASSCTPTPQPCHYRHDEGDHHGVHPAG